MRILVVGSGGREHAIAWALAKSPRTEALYVAPGNPGTAAVATNVPIGAEDIDGLVDLAQREAIDLCVIGPEVPLVMGLADRLRDAGIGVVGPSAKAAQLEGSKAFAKSFMARNGIPTASYRTFASSEYEEAVSFTRAEGAPIVIKASGLAAGKGAVVCLTLDHALSTLDDMMNAGVFGSSADQVVVESFMQGEEASVFAMCDGSDYVLLTTAQDHKRIGEGDTGPNTGGMGAYGPAPVMTSDLLRETCRTVIEPTLRGMEAEGAPYQGILYVGLMMTEEGPKVVEFNCRLGDPETQVLMMMLESDAVDLFEATANERLDGHQVTLADGAAACVVLASEGYPGSYPKGRLITGLEKGAEVDGVEVFHAGTRSEGDGIVTSGGRVLGVTARAGDLESALSAAYQAVDAIHFEGAQVRRDIGQKGLARLSALRKSDAEGVMSGS